MNLSLTNINNINCAVALHCSPKIAWPSIIEAAAKGLAFLCYKDGECMGVSYVDTHQEMRVYCRKKFRKHYKAHHAVFLEMLARVKTRPLKLNTTSRLVFKMACASGFECHIENSSGMGVHYNCRLIGNENGQD